MNLDLNIPAIDVKASIEGVWCEYDSTISFKIGREGTPEYRRAIQDIYSKNKRAIDAKTLTDDESDLELVKVVVEHILLGWKGLTSKGEEYPYNKDNAIALLTDRAYFELRKWIVTEAQNMQNFRAEEIKKQEKPSKNT